MKTLTTDRAIKRAYFTDGEGGNMLEFQFAPFELEFTEGGRFSDRIQVGNYFNNMMWISGRPMEFNLDMFIDRTQESFTADEINNDPFANIKRFSHTTPKYFNFDIVNLVKGIISGNSSSGFQSSFKKRYTGDGNTVEPSTYTASPHYEQKNINGDVGVLNDLEKLLYYVRPMGLKLASAELNSDGVVKLTDYEQSRFTPPPKFRFYYGSMWREGYILEIKYKLSVMNKLLVPQRLEARIKLGCTRMGYFNEVSLGGGNASTELKLV